MNKKKEGTWKKMVKNKFEYRMKGWKKYEKVISNAENKTVSLNFKKMCRYENITHIIISCTKGININFPLWF